MKKQFLLLTTVCVVVFISCSKEKVGTISSPDQVLQEELNYQKPGTPANSNLNKNLEGLFEFNGNLKDKTGKLGEAVCTTNGGDIYTTDRNGNPNSAIVFNGRYGIDIFDVPLFTSMSVAVWIKYDSLPADYNYFVKANAPSPEFAQALDNLYGIITTPMTTGVPAYHVDNNWHHLVATYDANQIKFYLDGAFVGDMTNVSPGTWVPGLTVDYQAGYTTWAYTTIINTLWYGAMDDLRFYTRILSATDVQKLYAL